MGTRLWAGQDKMSQGLSKNHQSCLEAQLLTWGGGGFRGVAPLRSPHTRLFKKLLKHG